MVVALLSSLRQDHSCTRGMLARVEISDGPTTTLSLLLTYRILDDVIGFRGIAGHTLPRRVFMCRCVNEAKLLLWCRKNAIWRDDEDTYIRQRKHYLESGLRFGVTRLTSGDVISGAGIKLVLRCLDMGADRLENRLHQNMQNCREQVPTGQQ